MLNFRKHILSHETHYEHSTASVDLGVPIRRVLSVSRITTLPGHSFIYFNHASLMMKQNHAKESISITKLYNLYIWHTYLCFRTKK